MTVFAHILGMPDAVIIVPALAVSLTGVIWGEKLIDWGGRRRTERARENLARQARERVGQ